MSVSLPEEAAVAGIMNVCQPWLRDMTGLGGFQ
jgi:hypothetical protein